MYKLINSSYDDDDDDDDDDVSSDYVVSMTFDCEAVIL